MANFTNLVVPNAVHTSAADTALFAAQRAEVAYENVKHLKTELDGTQQSMDELRALIDVASKISVEGVQQIQTLVQAGSGELNALLASFTEVRDRLEYLVEHNQANGLYIGSLVSFTALTATQRSAYTDAFMWDDSMTITYYPIVAGQIDVDNSVGLGGSIEVDTAYLTSEDGVIGFATAVIAALNNFNYDGTIANNSVLGNIISGIEDDIVDLQSDISTVNESITAVESDISTINEQLEGVEEFFASL